MRKAPVLFMFLVSTTLVTASEFGQLMDCTDVVLGPGYSCNTWSVLEQPSDWIGFPEHRRTIDNEGRILRMRREEIFLPCSTVGVEYRHTLIAFDGQTESVLAQFEDRCAPGAGPRDTMWIQEFAAPDAYFLFDAVNGAVLFSIQSCIPGSSCRYCERQRHPCRT